MKSTVHLLACLTVVGLALLTSCGQNKKLLSSRAQVAQLKKDSTETKRKLDSLAHKEKLAKEDAIVPLEKKTSNMDTKVDANITFPPNSIASIFKSQYPAASQVAWTKERLILAAENKEINCYKSCFLIIKNKNTVMYAESGELIETRVQILPEQLPQNIHDAIKSKYPENKIMYASTFKNTKIDGSYVAMIKIPSQVEEKEIILTENGTFVK